MELLPAAWQYPEIAAARVVLDGHDFATADFAACVDKQSVGLLAKGRPRVLTATNKDSCTWVRS